MRIDKLNVGHHEVELEQVSCIAETQGYRIYAGMAVDADEDGSSHSDNNDDEKSRFPVILKVAKTFEDNDVLAREASKFSLFGIFQDRLTELEKLETPMTVHYDWFFANLLTSFTKPDFGERRINVFTIPDMTDGLVPLARLRATTELDTGSSFCMLLLFCKIYGFFELLATDDGNGMVVNYPLFSPDDYLFAPRSWRLIYYNFSGDAPDMMANDFVRVIASFVRGWTVFEKTEAGQRYAKLLEDLSEIGRDSFVGAILELLRLRKDLKLENKSRHIETQFVYRKRDAHDWTTVKSQKGNALVASLQSLQNLRSRCSIAKKKAAAEYSAAKLRSELARVAECRDEEILDEKINPAIKPMRRAEIHLEPHRQQWGVAVGCPLDIEICYDSTASMGEYPSNMWNFDRYYLNGWSQKTIWPGYAPLFCLDSFGDCGDQIVLRRTQFTNSARELRFYADKIMPKQRGGLDNAGEDPQYAMFARAYLTDTYANRIGLKGYHFIVTDEPCHNQLRRQEIMRIFGDDIFENELREMRDHIPSMKEMVRELKRKTHQFVLVLRSYRYPDTLEQWRRLCGGQSVIVIDDLTDVNSVIVAIIGLTEGTLDVAGLRGSLNGLLWGVKGKIDLAKQLTKIDIGAQARLRHMLPRPMPKAGDIFARKDDLWPIRPEEIIDNDEPVAPSHVKYY